MLNIILDTIGVVCAVGLAWCLFRASLPEAPKDGHADPIVPDDYLRKLTLVSGISAYDAFRISVGWALMFGGPWPALTGRELMKKALSIDGGLAPSFW